MANLGYLQRNENPNSRVRADGRRYWGYPSRREPVQVIVIHTAETEPGTASAEAVARYFTISTRAASYHKVGDSDSYVECLPYEATAFGARGWNASAWHWSFATRASLWGRDSVWDTKALNIGAAECAKAADHFGIPVRKISRAQAHAGQRGFISHAELDPTRRSDPGLKFPWGRFMQLTREAQEEDMPLTDSDIDRIWDVLVSDDPPMRAKSALKWAWLHSRSVKDLVQGLNPVTAEMLESKILAAGTSIEAKAVIEELAEVLDRGLD